MVMTRQVKLIFAGVGIGAGITMGVLGAVFAPPLPSAGTVSQPDMTIGETRTTTTGNTDIDTPIATPSVTAEPAPTAD